MSEQRTPSPDSSSPGAPAASSTPAEVAAATSTVTNTTRSLRQAHWRIALGAMRVAFFLLLAKVVGAIKEMAVASRYGLSEVVDAYQFTMTLSTWLPTTLVGAFSIVLIPTLVRLHYEKPAVARQFLSQLQGYLLLVAVLLGTLTWWLWPTILALAGAAFDEVTQGYSQQLIYAFAPVAALIVWIGFSMSQLRARERHINTLLDSLPALFVLLWIVLRPGDRSVMPLLWGTVVGYLLQALVLHYLTWRARGGGRPLWPSLSLSSPYWSGVVAAAGVMIVGQVAMSFVGPLDQMVAAQLGQHANSTLGYASRLLSLVLGLGAASVGRAALPVLADLQAQGDAQRAQHMAIIWSVAMLLLGTVVALVLWGLSPYLVALIFERGAFMANDSVAVTSVMRYGLVQLPFYFGVLVLVQLLASQQRYGLMASIAVGNFLVKAAMTLWLAPRYGAEGIMLATGLMYLFSFICYLVAVKMSPSQAKSQ